MNEEKLKKILKVKNKKNIVKKLVRKAAFEYSMKEKVDTNKGNTYSISNI